MRWADGVGLSLHGTYKPPRPTSLIVPLGWARGTRLPQLALGEAAKSPRMEGK